MTKKVSHFGWLATGLAISGLAMTPALAKVLSGDDTMVSLKTLGSIGSFTVAGADPDLVAKYNLNALRGNASFKFTPSGGTRDGERSVTVVVRQKADAVSIRENILAAAPGSGVTSAAKIAPVSYSLGAAKGLKSFAIPVKKLNGNMPDLSEIGGERLLGEEDKARRAVSTRACRSMPRPRSTPLRGRWTRARKIIRLMSVAAIRLPAICR
ncbi:hypothetical protein [Sphingopyxis sp. BSNA05]|uniref:hypothetical protein n=1 Tax=Sphingopyxis sp. BSNA05 TaxID=1236614 RepID=UPI001C277528|nr:hypothetical protein [Sphingopyxis sp. BSNA05]